MSEIETKLERQEGLKKALAGTAIAASLLVSLATGDYYLVADIELAGQTFTGHEYSQLKPALVARIKERGVKPITFREKDLWVAAWNRENEECGFVMADVTDENIVEKLNEQLEKGC